MLNRARQGSFEASPVRQLDFLQVFGTSLVPARARKSVSEAMVGCASLRDADPPYVGRFPSCTELFRTGIEPPRTRTAVHEDDERGNLGVAMYNPNCPEDCYEEEGRPRSTYAAKLGTTPRNHFFRQQPCSAAAPAC
jgi:hypothetical protein